MEKYEGGERAIDEEVCMQKHSGYHFNYRTQKRQLDLQKLILDSSRYGKKEKKREGNKIVNWLHSTKDDTFLV